MNRSGIIAALLSVSAAAGADMHALIVAGLGGDPAYAEQFERQAGQVDQALRSLTDADNVLVLSGADASRDAVLTRIRELQGRLGQRDQFALFLLGHGSYDEHEYKFNLPGPDLTDADIVAALDALPVSSQVLVNTSSASGALADLATADGRIVVLATRSGVERHATRFGNYFTAALSDEAADTDKNARISVAEAFQFAERRVAEYYERNDQLATEHPLLHGAQPDRVALARLGGTLPAVVDTVLAAMLAERDALNTGIDELRLARDTMAAADYQSALLEKMLELARIEDAIEARQEELDGSE